jgi:hypothetical protein
MKRSRKDIDLDRLLNSAGGVGEQSPPPLPFGFDTRVFALAFSEGANGKAGISSLVRRVALIAAGVIVISGAGVYRQLRANEELYGGLPTEYAMIDTAIENAITR